jgi:hypothetical protein
MWILIIFAYAGPLSDADAVSITTQEIGSQQRCVAASKAAQKLAFGTTKVIKTACVQK